MKSDPPAAADLVNLLRQQVILAQVRIMELEDSRDNQAGRLAELEKLLSQAQALADTKAEETARLTVALAESQASDRQLRHLLQQTATQSETVAAALARLETELRQRAELIASLQADLARLDATVRTMQASRSWRWTAWLRALTGGNPGSGHQ